MRIAALTYVYNEAVNLPIWLRYYGQQLGQKNLFVVDRESNDGSVANLGDVNLIPLPRTPFDDTKKVQCLSSFQAGLLSHYDAVICGDCDEIVVPDPERYRNLRQYIEQMSGDYATCIGVDVVHTITEEPPIDLSRPILSQRRYGCFRSVGCKTLVSKVPIKWEPGLHFSNMRPKFDSNLINFHLKWMDYGCAVKRQAINQATEWSEASLAASHGVHHRYDLEQFVREGFLDALNTIKQYSVGKFEFSDIVAALEGGIMERGGAHGIPRMASFVEIPTRFSDLI